jgi:hypothetical protein
MQGDLGDLDDRNQASSTVSSRTGDCLPDGDFRQIHLLVDLDAKVLIQTVPDVVRSAAGVPQTEPEDGWCVRPSSMPDALRRSVASLNAGARRDVADRIFADLVAKIRNERGLFQLGLAWGEILRPPGVTVATVDQSQIVSSAETLDAAETPAVPILEG